MITNPKVRQWIYIAQMALGLALLVGVALGVMDQDTSTQVEMAIGSIVLMLTGELARRNVAPAPKIDTNRIVDALAQATATAAPVVEQTTSEVRSRVDQVLQARRDLEARAGGGR